MTSEEAYMNGFCKAAEAMGVDPFKLLKAEQSMKEAGWVGDKWNAGKSKLNELAKKIRESSNGSYNSSTNAVRGSYNSSTNALNSSYNSSTNGLRKATQPFIGLIDKLRNSSTNSSSSAKSPAPAKK